MRHPSAAATFVLLVLALVVPVRAGRAEDTPVYPMRGVLRSFDPKTGQATVSHEAVPGYMPAMTMNFDLADPQEMNALRSGDTFTCRLRVTRDRAWIEAIHKVDAPPTPVGGEMAASRSAELGRGDLLPDIDLLDEQGKTVHPRDFRGKALAISFIYLRCPLPTYCPLMNRNFQAAQALLDRLGWKERTHFLSVSMDPQNDTPELLASFARAYGADARVWTFAVAQEVPLHTLGDAVGLEFQRKADGISHNLRTVVVDPQGKICRVFRGNTWTPQELAAELRAAAGGR